MSMKPDRTSRRAFLQEGSVLAAGMVAGGLLSQGCTPGEPGQTAVSPVSGPSKILNHNPDMGYRRLGKTELMVSEIVLGGHFNDPRGQYYWDAFVDDELPPKVVENRNDVVARCIDHGINYVDITYGGEALVYGAALKGRRDKMYIAADDEAYCMRHDRCRNADSQMRGIESCLAKLGTDHLDVWRPQFKHVGGHRDVDMEMCIGVFEKARRQGKVRFLGMSSHDRRWSQHVIETFRQYAVVYIPYTLKSRVQPVDTGSLDRSQLYEPAAQEAWLRDTRKGLFAAAQARDVGVVTVKPFSAGLVFDAPRQGFGQPDKATAADEDLARLTLRYILSRPDISAVAVGMTLPSYVDNNVQASLERGGALESADRERLARAAERLWTHLPQEFRWLRQWACA